MPFGCDIVWLVRMVFVMARPMRWCGSAQIAGVKKWSKNTFWRCRVLMYHSAYKVTPLFGRLEAGAVFIPTAKNFSYDYHHQDIDIYNEGWNAYIQPPYRRLLGASNRSGGRKFRDGVQRTLGSKPKARLSGFYRYRTLIFQRSHNPPPTPTGNPPSAPWEVLPMVKPAGGGGGAYCNSTGYTWLEGR